MRPVRLDLDGFAAFREPTTVDFTDADYFALVGPTGSGKSTVIDAMTFALYGSAPRWGSASSIQYALAPTANRGTVRLIFDVNGARYVVAREVRRSPQGAVSQKSCLLERFADPTATGAEEDATESLAADPKSVRQQVIELLGLEFDDFCTCVVLPQGEFATFLQASVTERQNILLKLIGAKIYDTIGRVAGQRADAAHHRVEASAAQLGELADATPESEQEARDREIELTALAAEVDAAVAAIRRQAADRSKAASALTEAEGEIGQLADVSAPPGAARLQADVAAAESAYELALGAVRQATTAAVEADRALAAGPRRALVEETLRWHADVADNTARLASVRIDEQRAEQTLADAKLGSATARELADRHRAAHHEADQGVRAAGERAEGVRRQLTELRAVEPPPNLAAVSAGLAAARTTRDDARQAVVAAEAARSDADRAMNELPDQGTLERIRQTVDDLERSAAEVAELTTATALLDGEATTAGDALAAARAELTAAHDAWEDLRTRSVAADLRPHLDVGEPCPVCAQAVTTLPPLLAAPALTTAAARRGTAEAAAAEAETAWRRLANEAQSTAERGSRAGQTRDARETQLSSLLPEQPSGPRRDVAQDRAAIARLERSAAEATARVRQSAAEVVRTQAARRAAEERLETLTEQAQASWARLNGLTGRLAPLGAPAVTRPELAAAWRELHEWASSEANRISLGVLPELDAAVAAGSVALREAAARRDDAVAADLAAREQATRAASTHHGAQLERNRLEQHLTALASRLADRPSTAGAQAQLIECGLREQAATQARAALDAAAERRDAVEGERNRLALARDAARRELHRTRDPLVRLGAPAVDDRDLVRAWADLGSWAQRRLSDRRADVGRWRVELSDQRAALEAALTDLTARLADHRVELDVVPGVDDGELGSRVGESSTAVRVEHERARAVTERVVARRAAAAKLTTRIAADTETQQVAAELQRLMRSQKFPQWLANAALDTLVADASASLMTLSNEQFELTHDRGEFFVIDHADADSKRSVRTLSGGETFQASLALALALSEQLATLAAGGRTTLDSIFLDEGFGTLDPEALEVVAGTLENLAQQDRMVGVVTHVSALAERIPVRFEVTRDSRTSRVERAGP